MSVCDQLRPSGGLAIALPFVLLPRWFASVANHVRRRSFAMVYAAKRGEPDLTANVGFFNGIFGAAMSDPTPRRVPPSRPTPPPSPCPPQLVRLQLSLTDGVVCTEMRSALCQAADWRGWKPDCRSGVFEW